MDRGLSVLQRFNHRVSSQLGEVTTGQPPGFLFQLSVDHCLRFSSDQCQLQHVSLEAYHACTHIN